jgi:hypothetical protein
VAGRVVVVGAFGEDPALADVVFAESKVVGGDVDFGLGESFLGDGELVHESETQVVFTGAKIDLTEAIGEGVGGFPADLATEAVLIAGARDRAEVAQEEEKDGLNEVPIVGATGKEGLKPEIAAFRLVDVDGREVTFATDSGGGCGMGREKRGRPTVTPSVGEWAEREELSGG